jgi:hypothetical protein
MKIIKQLFDKLNNRKIGTPNNYIRDENGKIIGLHCKPPKKDKEHKK